VLMGSVGRPGREAEDMELMSWCWGPGQAFVFVPLGSVLSIHSESAVSILRHVHKDSQDALCISVLLLSPKAGPTSRHCDLITNKIPWIFRLFGVCVYVCVCVCVCITGDPTRGLVHGKQASTTEVTPAPGFFDCLFIFCNLKSLKEPLSRHLILPKYKAY
jgi:hypothetical protein